MSLQHEMCFCGSDGCQFKVAVQVSVVKKVQVVVELNIVSVSIEAAEHG